MRSAGLLAELANLARYGGRPEETAQSTKGHPDPGFEFLGSLCIHVLKFRHCPNQTLSLGGGSNGNANMAAAKWSRIGGVALDNVCLDGDRRAP